MSDPGLQRKVRVQNPVCPTRQISSQSTPQEGLQDAQKPIHNAHSRLIRKKLRRCSCRAPLGPAADIAANENPLSIESSIPARLPLPPNAFSPWLPTIGLSSANAPDPRSDMGISFAAQVRCSSAGRDLTPPSSPPIALLRAPSRASRSARFAELSMR